ncbi:cation:proton antiporter [Novosphingobium sp.]|uniref:cation:proton antiporter n=1 Tax=Novosphingobium sp. TaxID=1874826 RepID=UPI0025F31A6A|nr:cation:proton antiporter [Novosphingobium sp.]MCC6924845.1 cation:proton antiporter [Novosphingobium sp.]
MQTALPVSELFLLALIIIFAAPYLFWRLLRTDYYAPLVVVQIISGILLGPGVLGAMFPDYYATVFAPPVIGALNGVAWWAVMLFVFVAGLELDLQEAWKWRGETGLTAGLALGAPLLLGAGAAMVLLKVSDPAGWIGAKGQTWQFVLGVGMACAVTALPILVLLMEKLEILRTALGQRILRYASLDDVMIWGVLAVILLDWDRVTRQLGFLLGFAVAVVVVRKIMAAIPERDRWYGGLIWLAACGYLADWSGLHYMVGAFLAGAALDARWFGIEKIDAFRDTVLLSIMPVFFLSTGLRTSWDMGGLTAFAAAALLLAAMVAGKLLGIGIAGKLLKWGKGEAWVIGWLLQTKALIMIIFVNILFDKQVLTSSAFTALLLAAVGSTMLTIPVVAPVLRQRHDLTTKRG